MRLKFFAIATIVVLGLIALYVAISADSSKQKADFFNLSNNEHTSPLGFSIHLPLGWNVASDDAIMKNLPSLFLPEREIVQWNKHPEQRGLLIRKYYVGKMELYFPSEIKSETRFINSVRVRIIPQKAIVPPFTLQSLESGESAFCNGALEGYRRDNSGPAKPEYCGVTNINGKYGYLYVIRFPDIGRMQSTVILRKSSHEVIHFTLFVDQNSYDEYSALFMQMLETVHFH